MGVTSPQTHTTDGRPRARGLGIPLPGEPGPLNAITDVPGVEVGTVTLIEGDGPLRVGAVRCAPASPRSCPAAATASGGRARRAGTRSTATAR